METSIMQEVVSAVGEVVDGPVPVGAIYTIGKFGDARELGVTGTMATMSAVVEIAEMAG